MLDGPARQRARQPRPTEITHLAGVFRRDNEPGLVPVLPAALDELPTVRLVFDGGGSARPFSPSRVTPSRSR